MKLLSIILLIAFVVLGYNVIKGQNGVMEYRQVSQKLDEETIKSKKLQARNRALQDEITDLKQGNKVVEELNEVMDVYNSGNVARITEEIGDLIFSVVNISRILKIDSEEALRKSVDKFIARFSFIESQIIKEGNNFNNVSLDYMNVLWEKAKKIEK